MIKIKLMWFTKILSKEEAVKELLDNAEFQFDEDLVGVFIKKIV